MELLDGDAIRAVFPGTGFSRAERDAHVRRVGFMASRLEAHGVIVGRVAGVAVPRVARVRARRCAGNFIEVYVATPLDECERRDVKGLYARRARRARSPQFTGRRRSVRAARHAELVDRHQRRVAGRRPPLASRHLESRARPQSRRSRMTS